MSPRRTSGRAPGEGESATRPPPSRGDAGPAGSASPRAVRKQPPPDQRPGGPWELPGPERWIKPDPSIA